MHTTTITDIRVLSLVGLGVRLKSIGPIQAKVYSVGLYLDQASARGKLKAFRDLDIGNLLHSKDFSDTVGVWLCVVIVIYIYII